MHTGMPLDIGSGMHEPSRRLLLLLSLPRRRPVLLPAAAAAAPRLLNAFRPRRPTTPSRLRELTEHALGCRWQHPFSYVHAGSRALGVDGSARAGAASLGARRHEPGVMEQRVRLHWL